MRCFNYCYDVLVGVHEEGEVLPVRLDHPGLLAGLLVRDAHHVDAKDGDLQWQWHCLKNMDISFLLYQ